MNKFSKDWESSIKVKNSLIHGKGMFAKNIIPKNELVLVIRGEVISGEECEKRELEKNNVYIFWNGKTYIDTINTKVIKYINHDCDPNCEVFERDEESLNLVAIKDIMVGEEITMDYGYEEIYENCNCRTCISPGKA
ncbi:MAG: SET domain-containing protein [Bacteroidetes bacterium]|nr:SET domain-containing protein [Bacteroidota bacterium]